MSTEHVWRGIVSRYYGKRFVSASWRIWMDVWCVVNGIKLTWLVDYLPLDVTKLRQLLEDSLSAGIFTIRDHSVAILMLNSDLLVINTAIDLATPPTATMFIDISRTLDKLVVVSECQWENVSCAVQEIQRAITVATTESCIDQLLVMTQVILAEDVNLSTVFGWLLGYPVIYWFDNNSSSSSWDSVGHLMCYSVIASNAQVTDHELYSFTIPEKLQDQLDMCIKQWFMQLTDIACSKECNIKLKNRTVNVQQLML